jgi:hypothetical protein
MAQLLFAKRKLQTCQPHDAAADRAHQHVLLVERVGAQDQGLTIEQHPAFITPSLAHISNTSCPSMLSTGFGLRGRLRSTQFGHQRAMIHMPATDGPS